MVKSKSRILIILSVNPACLELAAIKMMQDSTLQITLSGTVSYQLSGFFHTETMETKVVIVTLVLTVALLLLVERNSAGYNYKECYDCCYYKCISSGQGKVFCRKRCSRGCAAVPTPLCPGLPPEDESDCSYACVKSSCSHIHEGKISMRLLVSRNIVNQCLILYPYFDVLFNDR